MSELSTGWHLWVSAIVIGTMIACGLLITLTKRGQKYDEETEQTTGHSFDGIEELDNPLPKWWLYLFWGTIVYGVLYIGFYGVGTWTGYSKWSSVGQWQKEVDDAEKKYAPYFAKITAKSIEELTSTDESLSAEDKKINAQALATGERIFQSNCTICHGSTASGALGFPNLTDVDWLYGGTPEEIKATITHGRNGAMPAKGLKADMTNEEVSDVTAYVLSLSGRNDEVKGNKANGANLFATACVACHGAEGKGNQSIGAPNLTDNTWLYGSTENEIEFTITNGRKGVMPAWQEILGDDKIHALTAYIYSLRSIQGK